MSIFAVILCSMVSCRLVEVPLPVNYTTCLANGQMAIAQLKVPKGEIITAWACRPMAAGEPA